MPHVGVRAGWKTEKVPLSMDATPQISKNAGLATKYSVKKVLLSLFNSQNPSLDWVGRDLKIPLIPTSLGLSRADTGASLIHEILIFFSLRNCPETSVCGSGKASPRLS